MSRQRSSSSTVAAVTDVESSLEENKKAKLHRRTLSFDSISESLPGRLFQSFSSSRQQPSPPKERQSLLEEEEEPLDLQNPDLIIKEGFLTKQGGARGGFKNWKRRFIVLKQDCLYYYKTKPGEAQGTSEETDVPLLGVMPLRGAKVLDFPDPESIGVDSKPLEVISDALVCRECKREFSLVWRRHNCKNCGEAFCKTCLRHKRELPKKGITVPVRICKSCHDEVVEELNLMTHSDVVSPKCVRTTTAPTPRLIVDDEDVPSIVEIPSPSRSRSSLSLFGSTRKYLFSIKSPDRELWLSAEDEKEKSAWIAAVKLAIQRIRANIITRETLNHHEQWEIEFFNLKLLSQEGRGAFGEVYHGKLWGTDVAIKMFKSEKVSDKVLSDLKKEIAILSRLRHPNVVLYIGACTKPPNVAIVTEWCEQGSLHDVLHNYSIHVDAQRSIEIAVGIAQGMNYLHNLDQKIIHRDLKSHNILIDKNFTVKVADFGLSHVRERASVRRKDFFQKSSDSSSSGIEIESQKEKEKQESGSPSGRKSHVLRSWKSSESTHTSDSENDETGHYGILGTPEWMAPEVMEGIAYNQKVDVYSYGIVLCEIMSRKIPFRDRYKIKNYVDVVEAVLDDGARPTIPSWCGLEMKRLIEDCLDRDPSKRPTFMDIILRLRESFSFTDAQFFRNFDVPRLRELLFSDESSQLRTCREIGDMQSVSRSSCSKCGHTRAKFYSIDEPSANMLITRLLELMRSRNREIAVQACRALNCVLESLDPSVSLAYRASLRGSVGVVLDAIASNAYVPDDAVELLSLIAVEKSSDQDSSVAIRDSTRLKALMTKLIKSEIIGLQSLVNRNKEALNAKLIYLENFNRASRSKRTISESLVFPDKIKDAPVDLDVRIQSILKDEEKVDPLLDSKTNQESMFQILNATFASPSFLINSQPLPTETWTWVFEFQQQSRSWMEAVLVCSSTEFMLCKFEEELQPSLWKIRVSDLSSSRIQFGRHHTKPFVACVEIDSLRHYICFPSVAKLKQFAEQYVPDIPVLGFEDFEQTSSDFMHMLLSPLLQIVKFPDQFIEHFSEMGVWHQDHLLMKDKDAGIWAPVYAVLVNGHEMKLYEHCFENPLNAFQTILVQSIEFVNPIAVYLNRHATFSVVLEHSFKTSYEFCAFGPESRQSWVNFLRRAPADTIGRRESLRRIREEIPISVRESIESEAYGSLDEKLSAVPSTELEDHPALPSSSVAETNSVNPRFLARFGRPLKHGYMYRKSSTWARWKWRYFFLSGTELLCYESDQSRPKEDLKGVIYLATESGTQFPVYPEPLRGRPYTFVIENPSKNWYLDPVTDVEQQRWLLILQNCVRKV